MASGCPLFTGKNVRKKRGGEAKSVRCSEFRGGHFSEVANVLHMDLPETTAFKSCAAKHEPKSQYANYSDLPAVSFLRLTDSEAPEGTQRLSTTFSLAKYDAY